MIDLHIHTTASSDGQYTPREIFTKASLRGLEAIAFADHNSIKNIGEGVLLSKQFGIEFLPCLELNSLFKEMDLHILGYFIDYQNEGLKGWLELIQKEKQSQAEERIKKLNQLGFIFTYEDVQRFSGGKIPTGVSFLKAILSRPENQGDPRLKTYLQGEKANSPYLNFYLDYLKGGKPAFVPFEIVSTKEAIQRVKSYGGIAVLAHPSDLKEEEIKELVKEGLLGLEVYSSYHNLKEEAYFNALAKKFNLAVTAGSDFHGEEVKPEVKLGRIRGNNFALVEKLWEFKEKGN